MEYILLVLSNWAPNAEVWFDSLSGWQIFGGAAAIVVVALLGARLLR